MARLYNEEYDAHYDDETNEWLEAACSTPTCQFCKDRPDKPMIENKELYEKANTLLNRANKLLAIVYTKCIKSFKDIK